MADIPTTEPAEIVAGNTVKWTREDLTEDYPAPTWTLKYYFVKTGAQIEIIATAVGETFSVTVAKAVTAAWGAGIYRWEAYVEDGTERYRVDYGTIEIKTDIAAQGSGYDGRSHAKKVLDAIEAILEKTATLEQKRMSVNGMSLDKRETTDLLLIYDKYKAMYLREQREERIRNGLGHKGKILTRLNR